MAWKRSMADGWRSNRQRIVFIRIVILAPITAPQIHGYEDRNAEKRRVQAILDWETKQSWTFAVRPLTEGYGAVNGRRTCVVKCSKRCIDVFYEDCTTKESDKRDGDGPVVDWGRETKGVEERRSDTRNERMRPLTEEIYINVFVYEKRMQTVRVHRSVLSFMSFA